MTAYYYKNDAEREKLIEFIERLDFPNPTQDYKYFLLTSNILESEESIRFFIGKQLLNSIELTNSIPRLFTDFINIPDYLNTINLSSFTENESKIYLIYKKHKDVLLSSINKNQKEWNEVIIVQLMNPEITETSIRWFYISKFHDEFLKLNDPLHSDLVLKELNVLDYQGYLKEVKETMSVLGFEREVNISFLYHAYFIFNDYTLYFELPSTKIKITDQEIKNWKKQIEIVLKNIDPWIKNYKNKKTCR